MPTAFDQFKLSGVAGADRSPLRNLLDFDSIDTSAGDAGDTIQKAFLALIKQLTGLDLSSQEAFVASLIDVVSTGGPALQFAGAILTLLGNFVGIPNLGQALTQLAALGAGPLQQVIDALVGGLGGGTSTGNDPLAILTALEQFVKVPFDVVDQFWAAIAALTARQTATENSPGGASQSDDYRSVSPTGRRTNVLGTMTRDAAGLYLRTANLVADYMGTPGTPRKPATHKCATTIVIDSVEDGTCRAWMSGDVAMTNYAAVEVYRGFDGDALRIVTGSSPTLTVEHEQIDLDEGMLAAGTSIQIRYEPVENKFIVQRNLKTVLDWPDLTNIVTHTTGKTFVGAVTNADDRDQDGFRGPAIRQQTFSDVA